MPEWNELTDQQKDEAMETYYKDLAEWRKEHPEEDFSEYEE